MFRILRRLGHEIVVWDEEALVHYPPDTYFGRCLSPIAIRYVSHLLAWGEDNVDLFREYPFYPGIPIHPTGNPRGDLLRPEMSVYFNEEAKKYRDSYGDFILVNTNFGNVNAFVPVLDLFRTDGKSVVEPEFGRGATGMSRAFAEGLRDHRMATFEHFKALIPKLATCFPSQTIVVRPHPTENPEVYHRLAECHANVQVANDGNVIPWLMASNALIHNGCTTGVEAYVMGIPALAYQASTDPLHDNQLSNALSHQCFNFEALRQAVEKFLGGELGPANGEDWRQLLDRFMTAREGPIACERIVNVLEKVFGGKPDLPRPRISDRLAGWYQATVRRWRKKFQSRLPGSRDKPEFERHRFPGLTLADLRQRIERFQRILKQSPQLTLEQLDAHIFRIHAR